jgi:hypothetical protein
MKVSMLEYITYAMVIWPERARPCMLGLESTEYRTDLERKHGEWRCWSVVPGVLYTLIVTV